jgi:hypothetical protein
MASNTQADHDVNLPIISDKAFSWSAEFTYNVVMNDLKYNMEITELILNGTDSTIIALVV